jgi:altronate hydrolase
MNDPQRTTSAGVGAGTAPPTLLRIHPDDDVAVAARDIAAGETIDGLRIAEDIPRGHKVALRALTAGTAVRKFAHIIGVADRAIAPGAHVHTHNLRMPEAHVEHAHGPESAMAATPIAAAPRQFLGFRRDDGRIGTRNYIGILTSVNCSATVARQIARRFQPEHLPSGVDGVVALTHTTGCGMAHDGEGIEVLRRTLAGYARQPNFGGVLIVGLGCEVNQIPELFAHAGLRTGPRLRTLGIQDSGGTLAAIERGVAEVEAMIAIAAQDRRMPAPASALSLGLQCGASDAWSALSANPALGAAADRLVAQGGSVLLSETPEIYGAEDLLLARATAADVADALRARLRWWERYAEINDTDLDNNPSPGNLAGGITTILEKSLGAVAKSGRSPLVDVIDYAQAIRKPGLAFMDSPGYDPCSATGQIASGCNLLAFTTGRGAVFGAVPTPSLKLATTSELTQRMGEDIDIDCGAVLRGTATIDAMGEAIFERLLALASGEPSASEQLGFGEAEFVPWRLGAVM